MIARWPSTALSCLLLLGCDKLMGKGEDEPEAPAAAATATATAPAASEPAVLKLKGSIAIPSAVPGDASAVLVLRVPESLFASVMGADPLGIATGGMEDLKKDLDEFLGRALGMQILDAKAVAAFLVGKQDFGIVLVGVEGELEAKKVGAHDGVDLYAGDDDSLRLARVDDMLLMGTQAALEAAIAASKDDGKSAANSELGKLIDAQTEGAVMALAVDVARAPEELSREIPANVKIDRALVTFGADGLALRAEGETSKLEALAGLITMGLNVAADTAEQQRERAIKREDDVVEGAAAIIAAHYARSAKTMLEPKVQDGALTITVPMKAGDPAILAAVAGMSAAIAIPAFTKYMRRSKTSEARVQIAKMFDAASAYFNEEHVARGSGSVMSLEEMVAAGAPHQCPNDGKPSGQAGITPPLSVDCSKGPGGRCVPSMGGGSDPWAYDMKLWTDNDVWNGLNFQQEQGHAFHYNFIWANGTTGFGSCQFTAQAFGDLDGDGVFSTYERTGAADEYGLNAAAGLYIDREIE